MLEQLLSNGGTVGIIIIAVVLLYREVMRVQAQREWKKNGGNSSDLYTIDPRTGSRISFPALNLTLLTQLTQDSSALVKNECEQTKLAKESVVVLAEGMILLKGISTTIASHDAPIKDTAKQLGIMNTRLLTPEDFVGKIREAVSDEMRRK